MDNKKKECCICGYNFGEVYKLNQDRKGRLRAFDTKFYGGVLATIFNDAEYELCRCLSCGHYQYLHNLEKNKLKTMYYEHEKFRLSKTEAPNQNHKDRVRKVAQGIVSKLKKMSPLNPTLLDYGSGTGLWSRLAREAGFDTIAYEPHKIRSPKGVPTETNWENIKLKKFDVIICNQVLEHVVTPNLTVSDLKSVSKDGTLLYCAVPNAGKYSEKKIMETWPFNNKHTHILVPFQHLHGFTQKSLTICLAKQNFRISLMNNSRFSLGGFRNIIALATKGLFPLLSTTGLIFHMQKK